MKLDERIVLAKYHKHQATESQQFGCKSSWCGMGGFMVKESVTHYLKNENNVLISCLTYLNHTNKVSHLKLFKKISEHEIFLFILKV